MLTMRNPRVDTRTVSGVVGVVCAPSPGGPGSGGDAPRSGATNKGPRIANVSQCRARRYDRRSVAMDRGFARPRIQQGVTSPERRRSGAFWATSLPAGGSSDAQAYDLFL